MEKLSTIEALESLGYTKKDLERQFREATKRGEESLKYEPRAASVFYADGMVTVRLFSGWSFSFDPKIYKALQDASDTELADVCPLGLGFALEWTSIDQHLGVGPLILDLIGDKYINSEMSRRNGSSKSEKKANASRANGKLGGRPTNDALKKAQEIFAKQT